MSTYILQRALQDLKLSDAEVAMYATALRRRMDAALVIINEGAGSMPPLDPLIIKLEEHLGPDACNGVLHWMTAVWEMLLREAGDRFIAKNDVRDENTKRLLSSGWELTDTGSFEYRCRMPESIRGAWQAHGVTIVQYRCFMVGDRPYEAIHRLLFRRPIDDWKPTTSDHRRWGALMDQLIERRGDATHVLGFKEIVDSDFENVSVFLRYAVAADNRNVGVGPEAGNRV